MESRSKKKPSNKPRPIRAAATPAAFHCFMRNCPELVWVASPLDFESVLGILAAGADMWGEGEQTFAGFPTVHNTIVCLNLDYLQLAQQLPPSPDLQLNPLPADRVRIWLDGRPQPILASAKQPELLAFQAFLEMNETEPTMRWINDEGLNVVVQVAEIAALEYPASWGSEADYDAFGQDDDVIPF
ncbi:hypothetical protein IV102_37380 [bacterium]|nr:hypothetical protein [bacterium]